MKTDTDKTQQSPLDGARTIQEIPLNLIVRSVFQVRDEYEADIESLAADMAANGLVQPVTVRPSHDSVGRPIYETVAGHRRIEAARSLYWEIIPAIVVDVDDDAAERMLVAENFARRDLTPIEMADTAAALVERHGSKEAGRICGRSERWAQRMAHIGSRLSEDWRKVARAYKLSQASLEALCKGTAASQRDLLADILDDWDAPTVDKLCMMADGTDIPTELQDGGDPWDLSPRDVEAISKFPWQVCGCGDCDKCADRTDIVPEFAYDDDDDLREDEPCCLGKRCRIAKMKEWLAGRGIEEWSKKLGRAVRPMPKGLAYWCGSYEENAKQTVPVLMREYPEGGIRWFSEEQLAPKKKEKAVEVRRWPTPGELRDTAFCETVMAELDQWKPTTAELMRLAIAMVCECPISGKTEWALSKRLPLAKALSAAEAESAILDAVKNEIKHRAFTPSPGQFGPVKAQLDFWSELARFMARSDVVLAAWRDTAAAMAEQRIADVNEAKKAEKAEKRRAKR